MTGVSFVVPVFNKAPWLPDVLDRIAAQRGAFEREYVFVDDGSTDDSLAVLKAHTAGWPDVTIIEQENRGVAHATNRAIAKAQHPFIKLCDADDLLADGATEVLRNALLSHPQAMLAYGKWEFYDPPPATGPRCRSFRCRRPGARRPASVHHTGTFVAARGDDGGDPRGTDPRRLQRVMGARPGLDVGAAAGDVAGTAARARRRDGRIRAAPCAWTDEHGHGWDNAGHEQRSRLARVRTSGPVVAAQAVGLPARGEPGLAPRPPPSRARSSALARPLPAQPVADSAPAHRVHRAVR